MELSRLSDTRSDHVTVGPQNLLNFAIGVLLQAAQRHNCGTNYCSRKESGE